MRWSKLDVANIYDIHAKFGSKKLKTFPMLNFWKNNYYGLMMNFKRFNLLELIDYDKDEAKKEIIEKSLTFFNTFVNVSKGTVLPLMHFFLSANR